MNEQTQLIINQLQKKDTLTVDEIVTATRIKKPEVFGELRRLEKRGFGKLVIGRRGNPSRFVQKADMEKKVEDLWQTKFANKGAKQTLVAQPQNDVADIWEVKVSGVDDKGDVLLTVALPSSEVGNFMTAMKGVRHKNDVH